MTHGDQFPNVTAVVIGEVNDDIVLQIRSRADDDFIDVTAECGIEPYAALLVQGDATNDIG